MNFHPNQLLSYHFFGMSFQQEFRVPICRFLASLMKEFQLMTIISALDCVYMNLRKKSILFSKLCLKCSSFSYIQAAVLI